MVHALKEAWRVLVPNGIMIDVRPLSIDVPLEIVYTGGVESAGMIDMSPDLDKDITANQAIDAVTKEQLYKELKLEHFDYVYYWKTIKGMEEDIEEFWKGDVIIPEAVWQQAGMIMKKRRPKTQIRVAVRMKLGKYEKQG